MEHAGLRPRRARAGHAGRKVFPAHNNPHGRQLVALIIGLSGTGKTTTTFRRQLGSLPVQDDFIALMPGGEIHTTENGCFAKTYGLDPDDEPTIHGGVTDPRAWLENVAVDPDTGKVDFFDTAYTANGRATFPLELIHHATPCTSAPPTSCTGVVPSVELGCCHLLRRRRATPSSGRRSVRAGRHGER